MKTKLIGYFSISYPTDNPYLDNKYIGNTLRCAQQNLNNNDAVLDAVDRLLSLRDNLPVILLAYDESIRTANVGELYGPYEKNGISDIILVDEKDKSTKKILIASGFQVSCYVTFFMPKEEVRLAQNSNGLIYLQAKSDGKIRKGCETLSNCVEYLRS